MKLPAWTQRPIAQPPYYGRRDAVTIQRHRKVCCLALGWSFIVWALFAVLIFHLKQVHLSMGWGIFLVVISAIAGQVLLHAYGYLITLHDVFSEISVKRFIGKLGRELGYEPDGISVRYDAFLTSSDLELLQRTIQKQILQEIDRLRQAKRDRASQADRVELERRHAVIDRELERLAAQTGDTRKVDRALRSELSLSAKRSMLGDMLRFVAQGPKALAEKPGETKTRELVDELVEAAGGVLSDEARSLHAKAKGASTAGSRERYLREAITAQKQIRSANPLPVRSQVSIPVAEVRSVWDEAYTVFVIADLLPEAVDAEMARAILLLLIGPGSKAQRFQKKYWPYETLRNRVVKHYQRRLGAAYEAKVFEKTLSWLTDQGVLHKYHKPGEYMYSLMAKSSAGASPEAQELIRRVTDMASRYK